MAGVSAGDIAGWAKATVLWYNVEDNEIPAFEVKTVQVRLSPTPFGKGAFRQVHYLSVEGTDDLYVVKFYQQQRSVHDTKIDCFIDVRIQYEATKYADLFNARKPPKEVTFLPASVIHLKREDTDSTPPIPTKFLEQRYAAVEPLVKGKYQKWTNNTTFVSTTLQLTPTAFSHFTYEVSGGTSMVADIQGVEHRDGYVFTDPQMHGTRQRWGPGDLGREGFKMFFSAHECNDLCRALGLTPSNVTEDSLLLWETRLAQDSQESPSTQVPGSLARGPQMQELEGGGDKVTELVYEGLQQLLREYRPKQTTEKRAEKDEVEEKEREDEESGPDWTPLRERELPRMLTDGMVHRHNIYLWGIDVDFHVSVGWSATGVRGERSRDCRVCPVTRKFVVEAPLPPYSRPSPPSMRYVVTPPDDDDNDGLCDVLLLPCGAWSHCQGGVVAVPHTLDSRSHLSVVGVGKKHHTNPVAIRPLSTHLPLPVEVSCGNTYLSPDNRTLVVALGVEAPPTPQAKKASRTRPGGYLVMATIEVNGATYAIANERVCYMGEKVVPTEVAFMATAPRNVAVVVSSGRLSTLCLCHTDSQTMQYILNWRPAIPVALGFCPLSCRLFLAYKDEPAVRVFTSPFTASSSNPLPLAHPGKKLTVGDREADELWFCTSEPKSVRITSLCTSGAAVPLLLVGNSEGEVRLFNASSGVVLAMCPGAGIPHAVMHLALTGRTLYTVMENLDLLMWDMPPFDLSDTEAVLPYVKRRVYVNTSITSLATVRTPGGDVLAAGFADGRVGLMDGRTWKEGKEESEDEGSSA